MKAFCCIYLLLFSFQCSYAQSSTNTLQLQQKVGQAQPSREKTEKQRSNDTSWQPIIEMDGIVFPSMILATATAKQQSTPTTYVGDTYGLFGISITSPKDNCQVELTIQVDEIASPAVYDRANAL